MIPVAYDRDRQPLLHEVTRGAVDLCDERARRINHFHAVLFGVCAHLRRYAVSREHHGFAVWHVLYAVDETVAEPLQLVHDDLVVD